MVSCTSKVLMLVSCTKVLMLVSCTKVLMLVSCTKVLMLVSCTKVLIYSLLRDFLQQGLAPSDCEPTYFVCAFLCLAWGREVPACLLSLEPCLALAWPGLGLAWGQEVLGPGGRATSCLGISCSSEGRVIYNLYLSHNIYILYRNLFLLRYLVLYFSFLSSFLGSS